MFQTSVNKGFQIVKDPSYRTVKGMDIFPFTPTVKAEPLRVVKSFRAVSEGVANSVGSRCRNSRCLEPLPLSLQATKWREVRVGWGPPGDP
jgi:hypothetical protein